jgi:alkylhydroperoxidase family enzyme
MPMSLEAVLAGWRERCPILEREVADLQARRKVVVFEGEDMTEQLARDLAKSLDSMRAILAWRDSRPAR